MSISLLPRMPRSRNLRLAALAILLAGLVLSGSTATTAFAAAPPSPSELAAYADAQLTKNYPAAEPGAAVIVVKDGKVVLRKGYGMANLELGVPVTPESVFEVGSVTKQFTSAAIMLLVERGKVKLDDEITAYVPDFPTHGQKITVERLLTHTAGIANYTNLAEWIPRVREDMSLSTLIAVFKDKPLDFNPGEKWSYSNSGYVLLGAVIEKASGKSYESFVEDEIFKPLGMTASRYGHAEEVVPHRAYGYDKEESGYRNAAYLSMTQPYSAGSLMSTVDDLAAWDRALQGESLLKRASIERIYTPEKLASGKNTGYAFGWGVTALAGHTVYSHGGGIFGFVCNVLRMPQDHLFVAILSNNTGTPTGPDTLTLRIAAKAIGEAFEDRKAVVLPEATLRDYVGVYAFDEGVKRVLTVEGGKLFSQRAGGDKHEMAASAQDALFFTDGVGNVHIVRDASGKVTGLHFSPGFGPDEEGRKTDEPLPSERQPVKMDPAIFDALAGTYELRPSLEMVVTREGDHLFAQVTGQPKVELLAASETKYFIREVIAEIEFVRGAGGKVESLVLTQGGRTIPAKRVK
jgi:CubicO group peptidase (beta-lactamase class C family)